jgi:hypothetical protein
MAAREPRAWVLNLDAEHELERPRAYTPSRHLAALVAREQRRVMPGLLLPGDLVLDPSAPDFAERQARARGLAGACWSPTPRALLLLERAGARPPAAPAVEVLRAVNARPFAAALRALLLGQRWLEPAEWTAPSAASLPAGWQPSPPAHPGQALDPALSSFEKRIALTLEQALTRLAAPAPLGWLVRRAFGAAGRGRRRLRAGKPTEAELAWLAASLRLGPLTIEPFVEIQREFTRSAWLAADGTLTLAGPCYQSVDPHGAWQATAASDRHTPLDPAADACLAATLEAVGRALHAAGYFGPFGIDAYQHRRLDGRGSALNPLSEINARFTMDFTAARPLAARALGELVGEASAAPAFRAPGGSARAPAS